MRKLNLGCGRKFLPGYEHFDKNPVSGSVQYCDLDVGIPVDDASCSEILLDNVIEHVADIPFVINECSRCLAPGGILSIITPHFSSDSSWRDPTHRYHLSYFSFDYLGAPNSEHYVGGAMLKLVSRTCSFGGGLGLVGRLIFAISPSIWEKHWCFIFRGSTLRFRLEQIKTL